MTRSAGGKGLWSVARSHEGLGRLFVALFTSVAAEWLLLAAIVPFAIVEGSARLAGGVVALRFLAQLVTSVAGFHLRSRAVALASGGLRVAAVVTLATAGGESWLVLTAAAAWVGSAAWRASTAGLLPGLAGERDLAAAGAVAGRLGGIAPVIGAALGGALTSLTNAEPGLWLAAAGFLGASTLVATLPAEARSPRRETPPGPAGGMRSVLGAPGVRVLAGCSIVASFVYAVVLVALTVPPGAAPPSSLDYGFLVALVALGGLVTGTRMPARSTAWNLRAPAALAGGGLLLVALGGWWLPGGVALYGAASATAGIGAVELLRRLVAHDVSTRVVDTLNRLALWSSLTGASVAWLMTDADKGQLLLFLCAAAFVGLTRWSRSLKGREKDLQSREHLAPRVELLRGLGVFEGASRGSLETIAGLLREEQLGPEVAVVTEGDIPSDFFVVVDGELGVFASASTEDEEVLVNTLEAGDSFGEIGLLEGVPRTATVRTLTECTLYRIRGRDFLAAVDVGSALSGVLLDRIAGGLARTDPAYRPAATAEAPPVDPKASPVLQELAQLAADLGPALTPVGHRELLTSITSTAMKLFGASACSLALIEGDHLVFRAASGAGAGAVRGVSVPLGQGIAGWVAAHGAPLVIPDVARDPRWAAAFATSTGYRPASVIALPLVTSRGVVGVMELLDAPSLLGEDGAGQMPVAGLFAGQAALAIETAQLFADLGRSLFQAASIASDGSDLGRALEQVARSAPTPSAELAELAACFYDLANLDDPARRAAIDSLRDRLSSSADPLS